MHQVRSEEAMLPLPLHSAAVALLFAKSSAMQRFFLTHKEINMAEFARLVGINPTLLRNYVNGFKKPSADREQEILACIHKLGQEMMATCF